MDDSTFICLYSKSGNYFCKYRTHEDKVCHIYRKDGTLLQSLQLDCFRVRHPSFFIHKEREYFIGCQNSVNLILVDMENNAIYSNEKADSKKYWHYPLVELDVSPDGSTLRLEHYLKGGYGVGVTTFYDLDPSTFDPTSITPFPELGVQPKLDFCLDTTWEGVCQFRIGKDMDPEDVKTYSLLLDEIYVIFTEEYDYNLKVQRMQENIVIDINRWYTLVPKEFHAELDEYKAKYDHVVETWAFKKIRELAAKYQSYLSADVIHFVEKKVILHREGNIMNVLCCVENEIPCQDEW